MSMADPLPPLAQNAAAPGMQQQLDKTVVGIQGYSSSGHSDASLHQNGFTAPYIKQFSMHISQDGVPTAHQQPDTAAPPAALAEPSTQATVPSMSPAPMLPASASAAADVPVRSVTPSPPAAVAAVMEDQQPSTLEPACPDLAGADVKQEPASPPAEVQLQAGAAADFPAADAAKVKLPPLSPPPKPEPSEAAEVHAEYEHYMQRWQNGDTLAQRWHRLKENGKWDEIREDWDEWQQDLMLMQLQQQIAAANKGKKRGKDDSEPDLDAPRQTRNRRAPATLQDYQVDAPAPSGPTSREETPVLGSKPRLGVGSRADAISEDGSYSDGQDQEQAQQRPRVQQQQQQPPAQRRAGTAGGGPGSRGAYRPPPPVIQQRPPQPRPPMHHPGQQMHQQWGRYGQPPTQQGMGGIGAGSDIQQQLYQMGTLMGQALHQAGGQGGQAANMAAALEQFARLYGNDPNLFAQQMAALHQQQQQQQQPGHHNW